MIFFVDIEVKSRDQGSIDGEFSVYRNADFTFWQKDCADRKTTPPGFLPRGLFYDWIILNSSEEIIHGTIEVICNFNKVIQRGVALPRQPVIENAP